MGFLIWIAFAFLVGKLAESRGRGFGTWTILSLIFSPLLMVIILYCKKNLIIEQEKSEKIREVQNKKETKVALEKLLDTDQLERYEYLQYKEKSGTLTQEEFNEIKQLKKMIDNYKNPKGEKKSFNTFDKLNDLATIEKLYFKSKDSYSKQLILEKALENNSIKDGVKDTLQFFSDKDIIDSWGEKRNIIFALEIFRREIKDIL